MAAYKARISPSKPAAAGSGRTAGATCMPAVEPAPAETLLSIGADAREAVLSHLNAAELCQCQLVCKGLRDAACSDSLWRRLCQRTWQEADPRTWLTSGQSTAGNRSSNHDSNTSGRAAPHVTGPFTCYRQLYPALLWYDGLIGVWRPAAGRDDSLFSFRWGSGCVEAHCFTYSQSSSGAQTSLSVSLGGGGSDAWVSDLRADKCTLAIAPPRRLHRSPSQGAQAAAAVAANRAADTALFGTSPKGSFNHEMAHWMESNIAKPRRRNSRGTPQGPPMPMLHHLLRVHRPMPSRKHTLAGLWRGRDLDDASNSSVIIRVEYSFAGHAAQIVATQVNRGSISPSMWTAVAAPVPSPWDEREESYVDLRGTLARQNAEENEHDSCHLGNQVASIRKGQGRCPESHTYLPGRLFVYGNGRIGFLWLLRGNSVASLTDYTRLDTFP